MTRQICRQFSGRHLWRRAVAVGCLFVVCLCVPAVRAAEDVQDLQGDVKKIEKKISKEKKKLQETKAQLSQVQRSLQQTVQRVSRTEDQLDRINAEIAQRERALDDLKKKLAFQRSVLKSTVRELYSMERDGAFLQLFRARGGRFFSVDHDQMITVRNRVLREVAAVEQMKKAIETARAQLAVKREEHKDLLWQQKKEQQALAATRNQVAQTVRRRAATLAQLQQELAQVRSKLSALLGRAVNAKDIVEAAKIASKATGVRKDFLLGELVVETKLGTYTGGCYYKAARMTSTNKTLFKAIAKSLGKNYKKLKVSCPAKYRIGGKLRLGHGGAMGVAQFMPSTWEGYKARIAAATGHNPPDPWSLTDGVMAMALYLKDKGAGSEKGEFLASRRYLCGYNGAKNKHCGVKYARDVQYWADNYKRLID